MEKTLFFNKTNTKLKAISVKIFENYFYPKKIQN
jgi:hypothetical protein